MAPTSSVQGLIHLSQCSLIFSLSEVQHISFSTMKGFTPLVGGDTNIAKGSPGEGVVSTYSDLTKFTHCSLLSGVSVESPWPSLLHGYSNIKPREVWSPTLPSYSCDFLIVFMICFILSGKVLAPFCFWPSRKYLGFFLGLMVPQTAGISWQNIYFAHRSDSQLCGLLHPGRLDN